MMATKREKSNVYEQIDKNLKRVYEDALNQELPDKFLDLIAQLSGKETKSDDK